MSKPYKAVRVASDPGTSSMGTNLKSPGKLAMQRRTPEQADKIDTAKTGHAGTASALVSGYAYQRSIVETMTEDMIDCFVCKSDVV